MLHGELLALLEGTADAAFTVDEQGVICSWNRAAEKLFGYSASSALNKCCADLFEGRGTLGNAVCKDDCDVLQCAAAQRAIDNYDLEVKSRNGQRLWVNISIIVYQDPRRKRRLHIHLARDITGRKKREDLTQKVLDATKELVTLPKPPTAPGGVSRLSEQETRVLRLLSEGKTPEEVARVLKISSRTLRNHLHHANQKLGTGSRLEAVIHAVRRGLI
jgi:PAS domain S-box-containing protein